MKGVERVQHLARIVGMEAEIKATGHPDFVRGFLKINGVTLGRAVIERGELTHVNWYCNPGREVGPWDYWTYAWAVASATDTLLPPKLFEDLCVTASELHRQDYAKKVAWRRANPKAGKRKKLEGRSQQHFLSALIQEYISQLGGRDVRTA